MKILQLKFMRLVLKMLSAIITMQALSASPNLNRNSTLIVTEHLEFDKEIQDRLKDENI